jgi:hypothetical protein
LTSEKRRSKRRRGKAGQTFIHGRHVRLFGC